MYEYAIRELNSRLNFLKTSQVKRNPIIRREMEDLKNAIDLLENIEFVTIGKITKAGYFNMDYDNFRERIKKYMGKNIEMYIKEVK